MALSVLSYVNFAKTNIIVGFTKAYRLWLITAGIVEICFPALASVSPIFVVVTQVTTFLFVVVTKVTTFMFVVVTKVTINNFLVCRSYPGNKTLVCNVTFLF